MSDETNGAQCVVPDCPEEPTVRLYFCPVHAQEPLRPARTWPEDPDFVAPPMLNFDGDLSDTPTAPAECCRASLREWHDGVCNTCGRPLEACPYAADHDPDGSAECVCGAQASGDIVGGFGSDDPTPTAPAAVPVERLRALEKHALEAKRRAVRRNAIGYAQGAEYVRGLIAALCDEAERNAKGES